MSFRVFRRLNFFLILLQVFLAAMEGKSNSIKPEYSLVTSIYLAILPPRGEMSTDLSLLNLIIQPLPSPASQPHRKAQQVCRPLGRGWYVPFSWLLEQSNPRLLLPFLPYFLI